MFLFKTNFAKKFITLLILAIIIGALLVTIGGELSDKYFYNMVNGIIGGYGEYDLLFTMSTEKEDVALEQTKKVLDSHFAGYSLKKGPVVAGSSNYLVQLPTEKRSQEYYSKMHSTFSGIPGLMSTTIITEPRLSIRDFRGESLLHIRNRLDEIKGVDFSYRISSGLDLILEDAENIPSVKRELKNILSEYRLFEIRFPLKKDSDDLEKINKEVISYLNNKSGIKNVSDVRDDRVTENMALLKNLEEMREFLLSYAARVEFESSEAIDINQGNKLVIPIVGEKNEDVILKVVEKNNNKITALVEKGNFDNVQEAKLYNYLGNNQVGEYLGEGKTINPRGDLALTLEQLHDIGPELDSFLDLSEDLIVYSEKLSSDLESINSNLSNLEANSSKLTNSLENWEGEELAVFLNELLNILDEIKNNSGDLKEVQSEFIKTSNKLKEAAGVIEKRLIYIPRSNELYTELKDIKDVFLNLSEVLDENYSIAAEGLDGIAPMVDSIDIWERKIKSLIEIEDELISEVNWNEVMTMNEELSKTASYLNTAELDLKLGRIRDLLMEVKNSHLKRMISQLEYVEQALPNLKDEEIVDTIELIDQYLAGKVIGGEQIQLLIQGNYDQNIVKEEIKKLLSDSSLSYYDLKAGVLSTNPRSEILNVLRQVRSVISIIIALIFTIFFMFFDISLLISVIRLNGKKAYLFSVVIGILIYNSIYYLSTINFPYLGPVINIIIGILIGLITAFLAQMLNPVSEEEWEAGKAFGYSFAEIMREIIIPSGKPGLLYLFNRPKLM